MRQGGLQEAWLGMVCDVKGRLADPGKAEHKDEIVCCRRKGERTRSGLEEVSVPKNALGKPEIPASAMGQESYLGQLPSGEADQTVNARSKQGEAGRLRCWNGVEIGDRENAAEIAAIGVVGMTCADGGGPRQEDRIAGSPGE